MADLKLITSKDGKFLNPKDLYIISDEKPVNLGLLFLNGLRSKHKKSEIDINSVLGWLKQEKPEVHEAIVNPSEEGVKPIKTLQDLCDVGMKGLLNREPITKNCDLHDELSLCLSRWGLLKRKSKN